MASKSHDGARKLFERKLVLAILAEVKADIKIELLAKEGIRGRTL